MLLLCYVVMLCYVMLCVVLYCGVCACVCVLQITE